MILTESLVKLVRYQNSRTLMPLKAPSPRIHFIG